MSADFITADLKTCRENVLLRRETSKDTRERQFGIGSVFSCIVDEGAPHTGVPISYVIKVGYVKYVGHSKDPGFLNCSRTVSSPAEGKKKGDSASPVVPKKITISRPSIAHPSSQEDPSLNQGSLLKGALKIKCPELMAVLVVQLVSSNWGANEQLNF